MVCRSLDTLLEDLKSTADDLWFRGKGPHYLLVMDARSKLLEARALADALVQGMDDDTLTFSPVGNMATNFLAGGVHHE
jgi:hypothetical protein